MTHRLSRRTAFLSGLAAAIVSLIGCGGGGQADAQASLRSGITRADSGDQRGAIAEFDRVLAMQPGHVEATYLRGAARDRLGDRAGAIADYDAALRIDAAFLAAYVARAGARMALGNRAGAVADYEAAARLLGNDQVHRDRAQDNR